MISEVWLHEPTMTLFVIEGDLVKLAWHHVNYGTLSWHSSPDFVYIGEL